MTSLQFTHVQGQGYTRGNYSLVQGKGRGQGYAQYHIINIHGCIFGPFHWHTMLSIAGIFAGQNLTTGKADAWNTHITLVPYSKLCVLAFPLKHMGMN